MFANLTDGDIYTRYLDENLLTNFTSREIDWHPGKIQCALDMYWFVQRLKAKEHGAMLGWLK